MFPNEKKVPSCLTNFDQLLNAENKSQNTFFLVHFGYRSTISIRRVWQIFRNGLSVEFRFCQKINGLHSQRQFSLQPWITRVFSRRTLANSTQELSLRAPNFLTKDNFSRGFLSTTNHFEKLSHHLLIAIIAAAMRKLENDLVQEINNSPFYLVLSFSYKSNVRIMYIHFIILIVSCIFYFEQSILLYLRECLTDVIT